MCCYPDDCGGGENDLNMLSVCCVVLCCLKAGCYPDACGGGKNDLPSTLSECCVVLQCLVACVYVCVAVRG